MIWTPADDAELRRLNTLGLKRRVMAQKMGRTVGMIQFRCNVLGLQRYHVKWRATDREKLRYLHRSGLTIRKIAVEMGRHRGVIQNWCKKLGLKRRGVAT